MEKKYGVWAMRSAGSLCRAAQSWCKHDGKPIESDTMEQAESYAKQLNKSCYSLTCIMPQRKSNWSYSMAPVFPCGCKGGGLCISTPIT